LKGLLPAGGQAAIEGDVEGQERHKLGPGVFPEPDDRRIPAAPRFGELAEALFGGRWVLLFGAARFAGAGVTFSDAQFNGRGLAAGRLPPATVARPGSAGPYRFQ